MTEVREKIRSDALAVEMSDDPRKLRDGGAGASAYAEAVSVYLAIALDRVIDGHSTIASWDPSKSRLRNTFVRQAIPMTWNYGEGNPFSNASGAWTQSIDVVANVIEKLPANTPAKARLADAVSLESEPRRFFYTDPPCYDNVRYTDLSNFFYVWMRRCLRPVYPDIFEAPLASGAKEPAAPPTLTAAGTPRKNSTRTA